MEKAQATVIRRARLSPDETTAVRALATSAGDTDGAYPLSEHVMLHLRHGGDTPAAHLMIYESSRSTECPDDSRPACSSHRNQLVGYAHVDTTDQINGASAELCVHPLHRRHGLGRALVLAAVDAAGDADPDGRLKLWAHGDHPSANALALSLGFTRDRVLWQMRRSLFAPVPVPRLPAGVVLRPFAPGRDDDAWLALNTRAFADHPEQGRWTRDDLHVRLAEGWFDPNGFLLAERVRDGALLGFHWTKVHGTLRHSATRTPGPAPGPTPEEHDHDPIGEVYVLGVDPTAHGLGLGTALTLAGLRHLRSQGLDQVMLYVEETNRTAISLYTRLGFARWSTDVCFRRAEGPGPVV